MPQSKLFRVGYGIILTLLIVLLATKVSFIFTPIAVMVTTLFTPILLSGVLYYLFRPLVEFLTRYIPKGLAILSIYLLGIGGVIAFLFLIGPPLYHQLGSLIDNIPVFIDTVRGWVNDFNNSGLLERFQEDERFSIEELTNTLSDNLNTFLSAIGNNVVSFVSTITGVVIVLVLIPFVLFYMLKDGEKLPDKLLLFVPVQHREEGKKVLSDMDDALSSYIQGQIIVSLFIGVFMYIGLLIVGVEYSLILAMIAMFTNVIPFLGPFLGAVPSVIVAFIDSPITAAWVLVVVLVVQQLESNIISPQVMGRKLDIHPLTIILLLMVAGSLAGIVGMLLAVPTYAVSKVVVLNTYRLFQLWKSDRKIKP